MERWRTKPNKEGTLHLPPNIPAKRLPAVSMKFFFVGGMGIETAKGEDQPFTSTLVGRLRHQAQLTV